MRHGGESGIRFYPLAEVEQNQTDSADYRANRGFRGSRPHNGSYCLIWVCGYRKQDKVSHRCHRRGAAELHSSRSAA